MRDDFAHRLALQQIRDGDRIDLVADEAELAAVAERLRLAALTRFEAHAVLARENDRIRATGRVRAALEQACVATGDPVAEHVDEPFELLFVPEPVDAQPDEEVELSESECDVVFYDGAAIDLGSAIADTLALAINPYPRSAEADATLQDAGILSEEQAGPFAALAALKKSAGD
ncbi:DUF177 domain-containing protein [Sphingomonas sabuli]|uniref:DUF177 domain-containing protein n=1 Tax=Sphingomonas sabuli TaxID=2764186 RepID=A0A7G9L0K1_9SPHN|nr:DUF177 domain-containing protein [Sphingomonas sabuli]QNM82150.1 DUF177 domain-containing protein [Sphingomonas sabuli]